MDQERISASPAGFDVIIAGGGPAGLSTALHLRRLDPALHVLVLEKERYPREKLCGGGLTRFGEQVLTDLGLPLGVPSVTVRSARMKLGERSFHIRRTPFFRVVHRAEFDAWLAGAAQQRGVAIYTGEAVTAVAVEADRVILTTTRQQYSTQVLVGADGARGVTRRLAGFPRLPHVARLLEVLTAEEPSVTPEFMQEYATFDFSLARAGLQGYVWDFPSLVHGSSYLNRGIYDTGLHAGSPRQPIKQLLAQELQARGRVLQPDQLHGHPIPLFNRHLPLSRPRMLLVGDAAGADPLVGEGIAFALGFGQLAAAEIHSAARTGDFSFNTYRRHVMASRLGQALTWRSRMATLVYHSSARPWLRLIWRLAPAWMPLFHAFAEVV